LTIKFNSLLLLLVNEPMQTSPPVRASKSARGLAQSITLRAAGHLRQTRHRLGLRWQAQRDPAFALAENYRLQHRSRALKNAVAAPLCRRSR
jgi:hypothetical protein